MKLLILFLATYLIGAMPFGYWLGLAYGKDLTKIGSASIGATNVLRNIGKWQALLVLCLDAFKGFAPVYYAKNYFFVSETYSEWFLLLLTFVPIIAHSKSIFLGFKGGKSSATGFGVLLALNSWAALITISIWVATVYISKYSSLGSIVCIPLVSLWLYLFGESLPIISYGFFTTVYIVLIKHRANIQRLIAGTEPKINQAAVSTSSSTSAS